MKKRTGFTIVEVLISLGLVAVLGAVSLLFLANRKGGSELNQATRQIAAVLREAQSRSMSQSSSTNWGVYFANPTSTPGYYAFFAGTTYTTSTEAKRYRLPAQVIYATSSIGSGSSTTISFSEITGLASRSTTISLRLASDASLSSTIRVASSGLISF